MSVVGSGFKVVTEFFFNADQAISGAEALNKQVQKLSDSADQAIDSVANLGIRYAMTFSNATGGILGVIGNAIKSSDKFRSTQIELANTMTANGMKMNGSILTFNDALTQSEFIMGNIVKKAREVGISPDALTGQAKMFANMLAPKGLAGNNMDKAIELARVSMKSAPALGVSTDQMMGGIMSGISGDLSANTQFGTRLFMESGKEIEKATGIKNLKEFNKALPEKRINALIVGMDKLAGSADVVSARADTLMARLESIKDLFWGVGSILKPLGDVILPVIKDTLDIVIKYLKTDGVKIVNETAKFIKSFMAGPKEMLLDLMRLKNLSGDLGKAIAIGSIALGMAHAKELMAVLGSIGFTKGLHNFLVGVTSIAQKIPLLGPLLTNLFNSFQNMFHVSIGGGLLASLKSIGLAMARMAGFIGILLIPLQGLSNALERIKIDSAINLANLIPHFMNGLNELQLSFRRFMAPINDMIDGWSDLFYAILGGGTEFSYLKSIMDSLVSVTSTLSMKFLEIWGAIKGVIAGISAVVGQITTGNFSGLGETFMQAGSDEFMKTIDKYRTPTLGPNGEAGTVQNVVNNYDVTMNNNFKEVLQPDRIAFTIKDQLEKSSRNRTASGPSTATGKLQMGY